MRFFHPLVTFSRVEIFSLAFCTKKQFVSFLGSIQTKFHAHTYPIVRPLHFIF